MKYVALWALATAVAISIAWFGVRGVLRGELSDVVIEPVAARTVSGPEAVPLPASARPTSAKPVPSRSTPAEPTAEPSAESSRTPVRPRPTASRKPSATRAPSPSPQVAGNVRVVTAKGGEVTFTVGDEGCRLVSATPKSGYTAKVTETADWIRVDLVQGDHGSAIFCVGRERRTDLWEY
ncbi:hypothetical protein GCM10022248_30290 [Nonomuraea soli]